MTSRIANISLGALDPELIAAFWCEVLGWDILEREGPVVCVGDRDGRLPGIDVIQLTQAKQGTNRVHLDLRADGCTTADELERLVAVGATFADVGQGSDVSWVVLADPEGNEFCLLARTVQQLQTSAETSLQSGRAAIRTATKAIIIRQGQLLVTVNEGDFETFYQCPGGGQHHGETTPEGLRRECREEIGCEVVVGPFAFLRDYIADEHEFAELDSGVHQREAFFFCDLAEGAEPQVTETGDTFQTGFTWLPLDSLAEHALWPKALADWLAQPAADRPGYVGNVN